MASIIRNDVSFLISFDLDFLILKESTSSGTIYLVYNSVIHKAYKLTEVEMRILDLKYKYVDNQYIYSQFKDSEKSKIVELALNKIDQDGILNKEASLPKKTVELPSIFYLHLTYRCNLSCSYCYNRSIRANNQKELPVSDWITIIDRITPYAKTIILTGGEFSLYHDLERLISYIHEHIPKATISGISNGMQNYQEVKYDTLLSCLSYLTLSCDSFKSVGKRHGFNPEKFISTIKYIKSNFPDLELTVSRTSTSLNSIETEDFLQNCQSLGCKSSNVVLCPCGPPEIDLMPSISEMCLSFGQSSEKKDVSLPPQNKCGAGYTICSIDPSGKVFPCQSLHFPEFYMGNLLCTEVEQLRYINQQEELLPDINAIETCGKCQVRYLCGGGCPANAYRINNNHFGRNRLLCPVFYTQAISTLNSIIDKRL